MHGASAASMCVCLPCLQAVLLSGVNNSEAVCLHGYPFCGLTDASLASITMYYMDPFSADNATTQVGCTQCEFYIADNAPTKERCVGLCRHQLVQGLGYAQTCIHIYSAYTVFALVWLMKIWCAACDMTTQSDATNCRHVTATCPAREHLYEVAHTATHDRDLCMNCKLLPCKLLCKWR